MLVALMFVPALCMWTGYGVFQLVGPGHFRDDIPASLFLFELSGVIVLGWMALVAAELGVFSAGAVALLGVLLGGVGWLVGQRRGAGVVFTWTASRRGEIVFLLLLIVLMGVPYLRPHEFIFGGADAGVYVNLGANIARTGRWLISNPDLAAVLPSDYPMLFREQPEDFAPRYYHLPGFYVSDHGAGTIIPQFYPLHPVWLALAHGLGGVRANLFVTPLWGMLGVLALYVALREALGRRVAAVGAFVLALAPTQIWFSRYPTAEALTQFLLFGGLYAFARYARRGERWAAILAGLALGQVMLARIDHYFLLGALPVYAAYLILQRRFDRRFWWFAVPVLAMSTHSLVHAVWQGWPYLYNSFFAGRSPTMVAAFGGGAIFLMAVFIVLARVLAGASNGLAWLDSAWPLLRSVVAVGLVLLAIYAYFLRPLRVDPTREARYWYGEHTIPDVEPYNLVRLGWYLSPLGLVLGVLGLAAIVHERVNRRTWLIVGVGIFFSVLFLYCTFNNPHHVYVMRRYVPAVIPAFAMGMAYTLRRVADWRPMGRVLAAGLLGGQVMLMMCGGRAMIRQVDYRGSVSQFRTFSAHIPPDAIVFFEDGGPVGAGAVLGTPLAYLGERTVIDLQEDQLESDGLDRLVNRWLAAGRSVVVANESVSESSPAAGVCARWRCRPIDTARFDLKVLEASYEHMPVQVVPFEFSLDLYTVEETQSE